LYVVFLLQQIKVELTVEAMIYWEVRIFGDKATIVSSVSLQQLTEGITENYSLTGLGDYLT